MNIVKESIAFELDEGRFHFVATYLAEPKNDALIEISRNGEIVKSIFWPAYKVWNIADLELDVVCENCHGAGGWRAENRGWTPCARCNGSGYELTELGEKLIDFVRRHSCRSA
jgi:hypothetical protein